MLPQHTTGRRIDWPRLIENMRRKGLSMQQIADRAGMSKAALYLYCNADTMPEPNFRAGCSLITTWIDETGYTLDDLPTRKHEPSVSEMLKSMS
jgi:transcriptional regulator with XRE-family HTH domain